MSQKFYTPAEVADELRVTRRSVYEWLKSGRLRGLRAGSRWRIRSEDLQSFLQPDPQALMSHTYAGAAPQREAEERAARIRAARGALAHVPVSVDELLQWKREETERENRRWVEGSRTGLQTIPE